MSIPRPFPVFYQEVTEPLKVPAPSGVPSVASWIPRPPENPRRASAIPMAILAGACFMPDRQPPGPSGVPSVVSYQTVAPDRCPLQRLSPAIASGTHFKPDAQPPGPSGVPFVPSWMPVLPGRLPRPLLGADELTIIAWVSFNLAPPVVPLSWDVKQSWVPMLRRPIQPDAYAFVAPTTPPAPWIEAPSVLRRRMPVQPEPYSFAPLTTLAAPFVPQAWVETPSVLRVRMPVQPDALTLVPLTTLAAPTVPQPWIEAPSVLRARQPVQPDALAAPVAQPVPSLAWLVPAEQPGPRLRTPRLEAFSFVALVPIAGATPLTWLSVYELPPAPRKPLQPAAETAPPRPTGAAPFVPQDGWATVYPSILRRPPTIPPSQLVAPIQPPAGTMAPGLLSWIQLYPDRLPAWVMGNQLREALGLVQVVAAPPAVGSPARKFTLTSPRWTDFQITSPKWTGFLASTKWTGFKPD